jgi:hypothetical protein
MAGIAMNAEQYRPDAGPNVISQLQPAESRKSVSVDSVMFNQQSSPQVNAAPFLPFGYALTIRSQGVTGFGSK